MIVVTGSIRTGTSLLMQTLKLLGLPIAGTAYHDDFPDTDFNPNGYWELPKAETLQGINSNEYHGKAVKLFGLQLYRTNPVYVNSVIVCRRNKDDAVKSTMKLLVRRGKDIGLEPTIKNAEGIYDKNYAYIDMFLVASMVPCIHVSYEEMIAHPDRAISMIACFVGAEKKITKALKNVKCKG